MTHDITPKIDQDGALVCPNCDDIYLHHGAVEVFNRRHEDGPTTAIHVDGHAPTPGTPANNPSSRRDGVTISFWCETCGPDTFITLTLAQHKGTTYLAWAKES